MHEIDHIAAGLRRMSVRTPHLDSDGLLSIPPRPHCPICWQPSKPVPTREIRTGIAVINGIVLGGVVGVAAWLVIALLRLADGFTP